jgi:hypothetical protein
MSVNGQRNTLSNNHLLETLWLKESTFCFLFSNPFGTHYSESPLHCQSSDTVRTVQQNKKKVLTSGSHTVWSPRNETQTPKRVPSSQRRKEGWSSGLRKPGAEGRMLTQRSTINRFKMLVSTATKQRLHLVHLLRCVRFCTAANCQSSQPYFYDFLK